MRHQCRIECLEDRALLYAVSGHEWNDTDITFSFMPDGTIVPDTGYFSTLTHESNLFESFDNIAPTEVWQHEFARALQTWAVHTPINFSWVSDDGTRSGHGATQGDERFGDIRLGAHPRNWDNALAFAYYPSGISSNSGNVFLNSHYTDGTYSLQYKIGSNVDLYSTLLHETGHSLGLAHSSNSNAVMWAYITGVYSGLHSDDIAGIKAIYGDRLHDEYDAIVRNTTFETATILEVDASGIKNIRADLTTLDDVDHFRFTAPIDSDGSLNVTLKSEGLSLLSPKLTILDSNGNVVAISDSNGEYHTTLTSSIDGIVGGEDYIIVADNSRDDVFGIGGYKLNVAFGIGEIIDPPDDPDDPDDPVELEPDRFEPNDTIDTAYFLGQANNFFEPDLNIHNTEDVDYYRFNSQARGFYSISLTTNDNLKLAIVDANGGVVTETTDNLLVLQLNNRETVFLRVSSADGEVGEYDLSINRTARMPVMPAAAALPPQQPSVVPLTQSVETDTLLNKRVNRSSKVANDVVVATEYNPVFEIPLKTTRLEDTLNSLVSNFSELERLAAIDNVLAEFEEQLVL